MKCETSVLIILSSAIIKVKDLNFHHCYSPVNSFILTNALKISIFFS